MTAFAPLFLRRPVTSVGVLIAVSLLIVLGLPLLTSLEDPAKTFFKAALRFSMSGLVIYLLMRLNWLRQAHIAGEKWHPRWWLATLPMLTIVALNLAGANWQAFVFTPTTILSWLSLNISVGLFEETLLRGLCFCILLQAWQHRPNGMLMAALTQAVIFGLLHLINLAHQPVLDTVSQTIYATLLGIGFAGLTLYCRSLWPAVLVHAAINLAGSMNVDLVPGAAETEGSLVGYLVAMVIITLVSTLPGLWLIRRAKPVNIVEELP